MSEPTSHEAATALLIYEVLRLHGRLVAAGDALMADLGLSSARWQVLGTVGRSPGPLTIPDLARILGQSRQSIQRLVNEMTADGLMDAAPNPGHKRSAFVILTGKGKALFAQTESRRVSWTASIADGLAGHDANQAAAVLGALRHVLERQPGSLSR